jgi:hypothetical protein
MEIDDELAVYLRPGPLSVIIATCDAERTPDVVRGWGSHILDDCGAVEFFVGREPARKLVENLRHNSAMSVAVCNVSTFQALQLKGKCIEIGEPSLEDTERIRDHVDQFVVGVLQVGMAEAVSRALAVSDVIRLRFVPDLLFDQTPGPEAGKQR